MFRILVRGLISTRFLCWAVAFGGGLGAMASPELSFDLRERVRVRLATESEWSLEAVDLSLRAPGFHEEVRGLSRWRLRKDGARAWVLSERGPRGRVFRLKGDSLVIRGIVLSDASGVLPSQIELQGKGPRFHVIAPMSLRNYLLGVVAHEMPRDWPLETLKAQAVAARSFTLKTRGERKGRPWDLEASTMDQVFRNSEHRNDIDLVRRAVTETDGVTLVDREGETLKAFYHADCGGNTVSAKSVWGGRAVDGGTAVDAQCPARAGSRWDFQTNVQSLLKKLELPLEGFLRLEASSGGSRHGPHGRGRVSGEAADSEAALGDRLGAVRFRYRDRVIEMATNELRLRLDPVKLKSARFKLEQKGSAIRFQGRGFGHGVGLCQWGSRYFGQNGYSFEKILAHYYPKARLNEPSAAEKTGLKTEKDAGGENGNRREHQEAKNESRHKHTS